MFYLGPKSFHSTILNHNGLPERPPILNRYNTVALAHKKILLIQEGEPRGPTALYRHNSKKTLNQMCYLKQI